MRRILISAAHKSSGKTTISIGLCAALRQRGLAVQPFKKGPDYIDPMWLSQASGRACRNLDLYLMDSSDITATFRRHAQTADISIVEGNKGLYDGLALDGSNSNAALAKLLGLPVMLVLDARGMTRGIAPLILGYQAFDREINIAGVILNNLGGSRHESKLRQVIEHYTDVPVVGAVHHDDKLQIVERHLGLMPSNESPQSEAYIRTIGATVAANVDLDRLLQLADQPPLPAAPAPEITALPLGDNIRIGIARDRAFGFYYADDLDALQAAGADLVPFDALHDAHLPAVDALYIGGGFPEMCAAELQANRSLREEIRAAIESGMPAYAECGGLMYLARTLTHEGQCYDMVGAIPGDVVMHAKPVGRGYVHLAENEQHPWPRPSVRATEIRAHEFHYSSLENLPPDARFAYRVTRGHGIGGKSDGLIHKNLLASYTHLRTIGNCYWASRFVAFARRVKQKQVVNEQLAVPEDSTPVFRL
jgi:cobyrinic acid a,c-diamide synthase